MHPICAHDHWLDCGAIRLAQCVLSFRHHGFSLVRYMVSAGTKHPVRVRMRSPSFCNLSVVEYLLPGAMLGDAAAILGSIDIVVGETDR